jgi:hypothetical protein
LTYEGNEQKISYQLSAISYQLSAISYQLSAISYQLSVGDLRAFFGNHMYMNKYLKGGLCLCCQA